jgi:cellobiose phosphorylase
MYRLIVESLLGLRLEVDRLHIAPCLPVHWSALTIHYRYRETVYHIAVTQASADGEDRGQETKVTLDGIVQDGDAIPRVDYHLEHKVEVSVSTA